MTKRTPYQQHMDNLHVSEQKKEETLCLMFQENQQIRGKKAQKSNRNKLWIPSAALAAVVCLVLVVIGLSGQNSYTFESISLRSLPQVGARGTSTETVLFSEVFGITSETMFPFGTIKEEKTDAVFVNEKIHYRGSLQIMINGETLIASITDYEPPIYTVLTKDQEINKTEVRLAADMDTGRKCCVYCRNEVYTVLSSETLTEASFIQLLERTIVK